MGIPSIVSIVCIHAIHLPDAGYCRSPQLNLPTNVAQDRGELVFPTSARSRTADLAPSSRLSRRAILDVGFSELFHEPTDQVRLDGKTNPLIAAILRGDCRSDTDHFPVQCHQRSSRATRVDDGVCLKVFGLVVGAKRPVLCANDASADRLVQRQRAANRQHQVSNLGCTGIAQTGERKQGIGINPEHRCIVRAVCFHLPYPILLAIGRLYDEMGGSLDNMLVRQHNSCWIYKEA
jgi:hypothetical protein